MRPDKLTSKFQLALAEAQSLAVGQDHQFIEPAHVMVALLDQQGGTVRGLLTKAGVNVNLLRSQLGVLVDKLPQVEGAGGEVHIGQELAKLFNLTDKLAQKRDDQYVSSELFVLAALDDSSPLGSIFEPGLQAVQVFVHAVIDDLVDVGVLQVCFEAAQAFFGNVGGRIDQLFSNTHHPSETKFADNRHNGQVIHIIYLRNPFSLFF